MLMRTDPFRDFDRLTQQLMGWSGGAGTASRPNAMPIDAFRDGDNYVVELDLPGVDPNMIELGVERNVLTIKVERRFTRPDGVELEVAERPAGFFSRQLFLGDTLDTNEITAHYDAGVLRLVIPVSERAKPKKIAITGTTQDHVELTA